MPLAKSTSRWRMTRVTRSIETHKASKPSKERRPSVSGPAWCHSGSCWLFGALAWLPLFPARRDSTAGGSRSSLGFRWLSLTCLFITIPCFFPPWRLRNLSFFVVLALVLAFVFVASDATRKKWIPYFFTGLVGATIIGATLDARTGTCMVLGFFASVAMCVHLFMLLVSIAGEAVT